MRMRRTFSSVVLLLFAALVGIVSSEVWRLRYEFTHRGEEFMPEAEQAKRLYRAENSFNRVEEYVVDTNGDGNIDTWSMVARNGEEFALSYVLKDTNRDGSPDSLRVNIGRNRSTGYVLRDDDDDGIPDLHSAMLTNLKNPDSKTWFNYYDIDMDGRIDMMVSMEKPEDPTPVDNWVFSDFRWVPVIAEMGGNFTDGLYIHGTDGEPAHIVFDRERGAWALADSDMTGPDP